ncbi:hypothetical protein BB559_006853 [Furculomyces boomerangus]|uniref:Uncharacterized protein n=1 Tax=Furculomyces boomerangus TaxID=61424 RepID=A0A2T9Y043_9FUNG|nr:hypothetical protein BB559_006853 [Furculomyces boomerangus]
MTDLFNMDLLYTTNETQIQTINIEVSIEKFITHLVFNLSVKYTETKKAFFHDDLKDVVSMTLTVGVETMIDKSKAAKTLLMSLFEESGNHSIEGITLKCISYIVFYVSANARPSGNFGIACILAGPDAPLALEFPLRDTRINCLYDFHKPDVSSLFPAVDGRLSAVSYIRTLNYAYFGYI